MQRAVRTNFEEKASYIARALTGMTVTEDPGFLAVDCGLPSDTFNVVVIRDLSATPLLLAAVDHFTARGFPVAVWSWENQLGDADLALFGQHGLSHAETHAAMAADLSAIPAHPLVPGGVAIKRVETESDLLQFGEVLAALFGASGEGAQVFAYYERLAQHPPGRFPAMQHYLASLGGTVVAAGTLFVGSQTTGIYDLATRDDYRRRGIGGALFAYLLHETRRWNRRYCVLQASPDGLGIYERAGFRAVGEVQTFENRQQLFG